MEHITYYIKNTIQFINVSNNKKYINNKTYNQQIT